MAYFIGKKSYFGIARQTTPGTPETTPEIYIPTEELPDIKSEPANYYAKEFRGIFSEINNVYRKPTLKSSGKVSMPLYADPMTYLLLGVFGKVTSTKVSTETGTVDIWMNNYIMAETLPIWTCFIGTRGLTSLDKDLNVERYHDMMIKSMTISVKPEENMEVSVELEGASGDIQTGQKTPTYTAKRPLNFADIEIRIGNNINCQTDEFEMTIDRGVQTNRVMCTAGLSAWEPNFMYPTTTSVEGSFTMYFSDYDEYRYFLGSMQADEMLTDTYRGDDASRRLEIKINGQKIDDTQEQRDNLTFLLNKIYYDDSPIERSFDDRLKITFNFKAGWDPTPPNNAPASIIELGLVSQVKGDEIV